MLKEEKNQILGSIKYLNISYVRINKGVAFNENVFFSCREQLKSLRGEKCGCKMSILQDEVEFPPCCIIII